MAPDDPRYPLGAFYEKLAKGGNRHEDAEATVEIDPPSGHPPDIARTIYSCFLAALEGAERGTRATVVVRTAGAEIAFEIVTTGDPVGTEPEVLRDRVETLGGRVAMRPPAGRARRMSGSFPATPLSSPRGRERLP